MATPKQTDTTRPAGEHHRSTTGRSSTNWVIWTIVAVVIILFLIWLFGWGWNEPAAAENLSLVSMNIKEMAIADSLGSAFQLLV